MESYPLNKEQDYKSSAVNKAYMQSYLNMSREDSRDSESWGQNTNGYAKYKSLSSIMAPK